MNALRDWGHASDYVRMQWMMLQQEEPKDYVIATGVQYTVRQFIEKAALQLGITIRWEGCGVDETGIIESLGSSFAAEFSTLKAGQVIVRIDARYFRPAEVETLLGDPSRAKGELGWAPEKTLDEMIQEMVAHDFDQAKRQILLKANGYTVAASKEN